MKGIPSSLDVVIIGAGPAGLGAAAALYDEGVRSLAVFERNTRAGGVLPQCIHPGFGLEVFSQEMTGPEFARRILRETTTRGLEVFTGTMVLQAEPGRVVVSSISGGIKEIEAGRIILASGCRERTREALEIPGTRPAGIYTAGQAQTLINLGNLKIGNRVVIQGSGDIGMIMARRLTIEGGSVQGVYERLPYLSGLIRNKIQCLDHFDIPLILSRQITRVLGEDRVEAVEVSLMDKGGPVAGSETVIACDTVLFSVGLIPEVDLFESSGVRKIGRMFPETGPDYQTAVDGLFICGNSLHINDLADNAWLEGRECGRACAASLAGRTPRRALSEGLPYINIAPQGRYTDDFFKELDQSGAVVCIACPRGCRLSEGVYGCSQGKNAYFDEVRGRYQRFSTTVMMPRSGGLVQVPAVSLSAVDVRDIPRLKERLEKACMNSSQDSGAPEVFMLDVEGVLFRIDGNGTDDPALLYPGHPRGSKSIDLPDPPPGNTF